jgi:hypothetical protein
MTKHYVNETGTELVLDVGVLIGSATQQHIKYRKPDGVTTGTFEAELYSSYSELAQATGTYLLKHVTAITDFTMPGEWRLHAYVGAVGGTWLGELVKLNIYDTYQ